MKKAYLIGMMSLILLVPATLMAMDHSKMDHSKMGHGTMDHSSKESVHKGMDHGNMDHGGMGMKGDMLALGEETIDGVKATVRAKDISAAMAEMGMEYTHHLMIGFANEKTGAGISKGKVAVKITGPDEVEQKPVKLMGMHGEFGADIALKGKGMHHLMIGTKLEDGKKRQYHFHVEVK